ncbi:MAG: hypothetical protein GC129_01530 [Proteobacteria bacterium]|nr:hypothetical protein [Pseudomonadota bacterium]
MPTRATLLLFTALILLGIGAVSMGWAEAAQAPVGSAELALLKLIITGKLGLAFGLAVAFLGVWTIGAKGNTSFGMVLILCGVIITMLPTVFNGFRGIVCPIVSSLGGTCGTVTVQ